MPINNSFALALNLTCGTPTKNAWDLEPNWIAGLLFFLGLAFLIFAILVVFHSNRADKAEKELKELQAEIDDFFGGN